VNFYRKGYTPRLHLNGCVFG